MICHRGSIACIPPLREARAEHEGLAARRFPLWQSQKQGCCHLVFYNGDASSLGKVMFSRSLKAERSAVIAGLWCPGFW